MANLICLHSTEKPELIWLNTDAIISVVDVRPIKNYTLVTTFAGAPLEYHVKETGDSVVGLIEGRTMQTRDYYVSI